MSQLLHLWGQCPPLMHVHCTVGWERTLVGLDTLETTKISCHCWGLSHISSAIPYTDYTTTASRIPSHIVKLKVQIKATSVIRRIIHKHFLIKKCNFKILFHIYILYFIELPKVNVLIKRMN